MAAADSTTAEHIEMNNLRNELKEIKELLLANNKQCDRMGAHIEFVESVYSTLKAPLQWVLAMWHKMHLRCTGPGALAWLPECGYIDNKKTTIFV